MDDGRISLFGRGPGRRGDQGISREIRFAGSQGPRGRELWSRKIGGAEGACEMMGWSGGGRVDGGRLKEGRGVLPEETEKARKARRRVVVASGSRRWER